MLQASWRPGEVFLRGFLRGVGAAAERSAVVVGENHERARVELQVAQRVEDDAGAPVEFLDGVAVEAALGFAGEARRGVLRHVRHRVRQVEEERPRAVGADERDRLLRVVARELRLIDGRLDDALALDARERA